MALTTTYMGLSVWDQPTDGYSHDELAGNWARVDAHDHASNGGRPLPPEAIPTLGSGDLGPCSVGTSQICDNAVTEAKIAPNAVSSTRIQNDAITNSKVADNAIATTQIASDAVTGPKIADSGSATGAAILGAHINDNAIANRHLANNSVATANLTANAVHTGNIQDGAVTNPKLADGSVLTGKLGNLAVTGAKIAGGTVTQDKIALLPFVYCKINAATDLSTGQQHILWDNALWDTDGMFHEASPGWITIQTSGVYSLSAGVYWQDHDSAPTDSGHRRMTIRRNQSTLVGSGPSALNRDWRNFDNSGFPIGSSVQGLYQNATTTVALFAGDTIDLAIFSEYEGMSQYLPGDNATHLSAAWIGPAFEFTED
jgi:hypothetical protein